VEEIYGERALELVLPAEKAEDKIADMLRRPDHYGEIVQSIRQHLREKHSQAARLKELIDIIES
jgi:ferritin-like metal-binding protein YciE